MYAYIWDMHSPKFRNLFRYGPTRSELECVLLSDPNPNVVILLEYCSCCLAVASVAMSSSNCENP
jgi:hypothetical protein